MTILARSRFGRIALHLLAMAGDQCVRFHIAGIIRELPGVATLLVLLNDLPTQLRRALVLYLAKPPRPYRSAAAVEPRSFAKILDRGDVLLSDHNTRVAALVKRVTRSNWSHVSMYVGPLGEGPDPACIVEADIAGGVRSIRLSEFNAQHVRVLRPIDLNDLHRSQLADWVVSRIGSEYDLALALAIARNLLRLPLPASRRPTLKAFDSSARRFICCSLLAQAFAVVGRSILPVPGRRSGSGGAGDLRNLTPADFERASLFAVVYSAPGEVSKAGHIMRRTTRTECMRP
jgi:hypothetical protein